MIADLGFRIADLGLVATSLSPEEANWLIVGLVVLGVLIGLAVGITSLMLNVRKLRHGESDTTKTIVSNVPLEVRGVIEYVKEPDFKEFVGYVHKRNHELATHIQTIEHLAEERRMDAAKTAKELTEQIHESSEKVHGKLEMAVKELRSDTKASDSKLNELAGVVGLHTRSLDQIDNKLTTLLQRHH